MNIPELLNIPINVISVETIQDIICLATNVLKEDMLRTNKIPGARKGEFVSARQISMFMTNKLTNLSLYNIGFYHGQRDHATVLHAIKTINNHLDCNDKDIIYSYSKCVNLINDFYNKIPFDKIPEYKVLVSKRKVLITELRAIDANIRKLQSIKRDEKEEYISY